MSQQVQSMLNSDRDFDTLGGRIARAREAVGTTQMQLAKGLAVKKSTIEKWETDRAEPRANRLIMISGILGVSPSWLLHGVGEAPSYETVSDEVKIIRDQLARIHELREQTDIAMANLDAALSRLEKRDEEA